MEQCSILILLQPPDIYILLTHRRSRLHQSCEAGKALENEMPVALLVTDNKGTNSQHVKIKTETKTKTNLYKKKNIKLVEKLVSVSINKQTAAINPSGQTLNSGRLECLVSLFLKKNNNSLFKSFQAHLTQQLHVGIYNRPADV